MCIGDYREKQRNKGERQQGDERAFRSRTRAGPTAIIGRALVLHSAFRPRSRTASRIFAVRRFNLRQGLLRRLWHAIVFYKMTLKPAILHCSSMSAALVHVVMALIFAPGLTKSSV